jgi:hypothetical protein
MAHTHAHIQTKDIASARLQTSGGCRLLRSLQFRTARIVEEVAYENATVQHSLSATARHVRHNADQHAALHHGAAHAEQAAPAHITYLHKDGAAAHSPLL